MPIGTATVIHRREQILVLAGSTIFQVFEKLNLNQESYLVILNGSLVRDDRLLSEGDTVKLVTVVSGGD